VIEAFVLDSYSERLLPCPAGTLIIPLHPYEQIEWHDDSPELRVLVDNKVRHDPERILSLC
jgi:hypothetical protein